VLDSFRFIADKISLKRHGWTPRPGQPHLQNISYYWESWSRTVVKDIESFCLQQNAGEGYWNDIVSVIWLWITKPEETDVGRMWLVCQKFLTIAFLYSLFSSVIGNLMPLPASKSLLILLLCPCVANSITCIHLLSLHVCLVASRSMHRSYFSCMDYKVSNEMRKLSRLINKDMKGDDHGLFEGLISV
jgi:hypothetical protein